MIDINEIKVNYSKFDDWKIENLAKNDIRSLEPEIIEILISEIVKRNLKDSETLINRIKIVVKIIEDGPSHDFYNLIKIHNCPYCKSKKKQLSISIIAKVTSVILYQFNYIMT